MSITIPNLNKHEVLAHLEQGALIVGKASDYNRDLWLEVSGERLDATIASELVHELRTQNLIESTRSNRKDQLDEFRIVAER